VASVCCQEAILFMQSGCTRMCLNPSANAFWIFHRMGWPTARYG
jgi:hypothetical protein